LKYLRVPGELLSAAKRTRRTSTYDEDVRISAGGAEIQTGVYRDWMKLQYGAALTGLDA
jgi:hypothetical protein